MHPILEAAEPRAARDVGAADAVVFDLDNHVVGVRADGYVRSRRARVLDDVGERLRDDEVAGRLHGRREAGVGCGDGDWYWGALRERTQRWGEAAVCQGRRVDAA